VKVDPLLAIASKPGKGSTFTVMLNEARPS